MNCALGMGRLADASLGWSGEQIVLLCYPICLHTTRVNFGLLASILDLCCQVSLWHFIIGLMHIVYSSWTFLCDMLGDTSR